MYLLASRSSRTLKMMILSILMKADYLRCPEP